MEKLNLRSNYRVGFRIALTASLKKRRLGEPTSFDFLRKAWKARCFTFGELSDRFPFLSLYRDFTFRRAFCDARDVFPPKQAPEGAEEQPIFRCHQAWVCPWCHTRPAVNMLRRVFQFLRAREDRLDGLVWSAGGWKWNLGRADAVLASRAEEALEAVEAVRTATTPVISRSNGRAMAFAARTRLLIGKPMLEGSTPQLVLSYRFAFLARPNALAVRRWSARPAAALDGAVADDPTRPIDDFNGLCRYLAAYPRGLLYVPPVTLAHLLRVKRGFRRRHHLVSHSLCRRLDTASPRRIVEGHPFDFTDPPGAP